MALSGGPHTGGIEMCSASGLEREEGGVTESLLPRAPGERKVVKNISSHAGICFNSFALDCRPR